MIPTLIDLTWRFDEARRQVAHVLKAEQANQQALAIAASQDPDLRALRVFLDRSQILAEFDADAEGRATPVAVVTAEGWDEDASQTAINDYRHDCRFHVDVYGYGVARSNDEGGHNPADYEAERECHRAAALVWHILAAAKYTHLGLNANTFGARRIRSGKIGRAPDQPTNGCVMVCRITLEIPVSEQSTPEQTIPFGGFKLTVTDATTITEDNATGEILLERDYPTPA